MIHIWKLWECTGRRLLFAAADNKKVASPLQLPGARGINFLYDYWCNQMLQVREDVSEGREKRITQRQMTRKALDHVDLTNTEYCRLQMTFQTFVCPYIWISISVRSQNSGMSDDQKSAKYHKPRLNIQLKLAQPIILQFSVKVFYKGNTVSLHVFIHVFLSLIVYIYFVYNRSFTLLLSNQSWEYETKNSAWLAPVMTKTEPTASDVGSILF